ncbi:unnamed protein product [Brachionus calyciflorus]|uniref:dCMP deaminase n=1 Tax=Brachionus calyciflorus TaxID=104777 RepID=A0A813SB33_9BILA|nr:unnamed protein product [Brachionus calyciflorus]
MERNSQALVETYNSDFDNHITEEEFFYQRSRNNKSVSSTDSLTENYELNQYFMNIAILVSKKRKNVKHQAGACIVNSSNKIIGTGNYTHNSPLKEEVLSWFKESSKPKNDYLNHAEVNAILNKSENCLDNCTIYVTSFPCIECVKMIAQSGIRKIVYIDDSCCQTLNENEIFASKVLIQLSGISHYKLE